MTDPGSRLQVGVLKEMPVLAPAYATSDARGNRGVWMYRDEDMLVMRTPLGATSRHERIHDHCNHREGMGAGWWV